MESIKLVCKDCGKEFEFTVGEQKFYEKKGFPQPIRCKDCRSAKKERYATSVIPKVEESPMVKKDDLSDIYKKFLEHTIKI